MFQSKDHVKKFFKYLNSGHLNIKFTYEEEVNNKSSFLDISIERINNKLVTSLYRKSTFSGVCRNFHSFLPVNYKKGLIYALLHREFNISFDYQIFHKEIECPKAIWQHNGFPFFLLTVTFINIYINCFIKEVCLNKCQRKKRFSSVWSFLEEYCNK